MEPVLCDGVPKRRHGQMWADLHEDAVLLLQSIPQLGDQGCRTGDSALLHLLVLVLGCQPRLHSLQDRTCCCLQSTPPLQSVKPSTKLGCTEAACLASLPRCHVSMIPSGTQEQTLYCVLGHIRWNAACTDQVAKRES